MGLTSSSWAAAPRTSRPGLLGAGARVTGVDISGEQLKTARTLQDERDVHFPLILGDAESLPVPDASFDLAISEYGASIWADPDRWIPEARECCAPAGNSSSSSTELSGFSPCPKQIPTGRRQIGCCAHTSGCTGSSGRPSRASSFISAMATGSGYSCERVRSCRPHRGAGTRGGGAATRMGSWTPPGRATTRLSRSGVRRSAATSRGTPCAARRTGIGLRTADLLGLLPDRDMAAAGAGEGLAVPVAPPIAQSHPGKASHEIQL